MAADLDLDALQRLLAEAGLAGYSLVPYGPSRRMELEGTRAELACAAVNALPALLAELRRARELERGVGALADRWEMEAGRYGGVGVQKAMDYCAAELRCLLPAAAVAREAPAPPDGPATERALLLAVEALKFYADDPNAAPTQRARNALAACRAALAGKEAQDG